MKYFNMRFFISVITGIVISSGLYAQQLAFPGAEGFGRFAPGGRNGEVYHVTNLNDSGTGSFRDAVSKSGRIVVFDVAGVIKLNSRAAVSSNITIAGQTAPGEGIVLYGQGISFSGASNTICRYLRIRVNGGSSGADGLGISNGANMIFDHVSVAWGMDEVFSINSDGKGTPPSDITIQNCIIGQGLLPHSCGGLMQPTGPVTIYRSLYIDNTTRNPKVKGRNQFVNNIVYNWKNNGYILGGDSEGQSYANVVGNYFISGPSGGKAPFSGGNANFHLYRKDNYVDDNLNGVLDGYLIPDNRYSGISDFRQEPYDYPELPVIAATEVYNSILDDVGATLPYRDLADYYMIDELKSLGTKGRFISNASELPIGIPETWNIWKGEPVKDTDKDGIPDEWETANGLNPNDLSDAMKIAANGYANIENYINSITSDHSQSFLRTPACLIATEIAQNEVTFGWLACTERENGFVIERKEGDRFVEIARTDRNVTTYTDRGLESGIDYVYRVKSFNQEIESAYSPEFKVRTKPIPVQVLDINTFVPDRIWTGATSANWDLQTANWATGLFENGQSVLFDDSFTGEKNIILSSGIEQNNMVVNAIRDYSFTGNPLSGEGSVNKAGAGVLSLQDNNTYTGATVIHGGTMVINKLANGSEPSSIGASKNFDFNWVWRGGKISYTGDNISTDRNVALDETTEFEVVSRSSIVTTNGIIGGTGDFIKSGPGTVKTVSHRNTYTGNTIVKEGIYEMNGKNDIVGLYGKLILNGGTFKTTGGADGAWSTHNFEVEVTSEKQSTFSPTRNSYINCKFSGDGNLKIDLVYLREYYQGNWNDFIGVLTVNGPSSKDNTFLLNNVGKGDGIPNARINATGIARIACAKNGSTMRLGGLSGESTSRLVGADIKSSGGNMTWIVGGLGTDETFNGIINNEAVGGQQGTTSLVKEGDGYWRLNGNNIYKGTTLIERGNMIFNGTNTGTGAITVKEEATLSGKGSVAGSVTVMESGTIAPGDLGIGMFTVKSSVSLREESALEIEIDRSNKTNDKLSVTGALSIAGNLKIDLIDGSFEAGDEVSVLSAGSYNGAFAQIIPEVPGVGLKWDTSSLYTSGMLKVQTGETATDFFGADCLTIIPSRGNIRIEGFQQPTVIEMYNLSGVRMARENVNSSSCLIDINPGFYVLKIGTDAVKVAVP